MENMNIDSEIFKIRVVLEKVFDKYSDNGIFEKVTPSRPFIYDWTIRFVPAIMENEIQSLFNILEELEIQKENSNHITR